MGSRKQSRNTASPQQGSGGGLVRLTQCMIVKNEEHNIERALTWGRGIVCEQIVVDTGSTDRTVELAERMGAVVKRFEWIKDFSAAKNFAIEQAGGNWIAFLDADEYIADDEVFNVMPLLEAIMSDPSKRNRFLAVSTPWVQLGDKGLPKEISNQTRIFRNIPNVRYAGRIHEQLALSPANLVSTKDFSIMHTGYTTEAYLTTNKASRNVELLRLQLADNPEDVTAKAYLADSLRAEAYVIAGAENLTPEREKLVKSMLEEVDRLYCDVLQNIQGVAVTLMKDHTYEYFADKYLQGGGGADPELERVCKEAYEAFPNKPKFACYYAMALNRKGEHQAAFDLLGKCEEDLENSADSEAVLTTKVTEMLSMQMALAAQGLGMPDITAQYLSVLLLMNKSNVNLLRPLISALMPSDPAGDETLGRLAQIYDMSDSSDLLLLARSAKECGAISLAKKLIGMAAGG